MRVGMPRVCTSVLFIIIIMVFQAVRRAVNVLTFKGQSVPVDIAHSKMCTFIHLYSS